MNYLPEFFIVATAHFLAVVSPGPDFIMITRNSLMYSKRTGIYSAVGLGFGILVHIIYSLVGIGLIISKSILLFSIIKFLGAAYLIYIGYKSITSHSKTNLPLNENKKKDLTKFQALKMGFVTNVTNPKATLFFLSLFSVVISPTTPTFIKILYGLEMSIVTSLWFIFVAILFSHHLIKNRVDKIQNIASKLMGAILIALGIRLALSSNK